MSKPKKIQVPNKNYFAWQYEEQTKIKHKVLSAYSKIWISKLGSKNNTIFFDCHGGCGAYINKDNSVSYGSSILVKQIADEVNKNRSTKTGVYYCEINSETYENFLRILDDFKGLKIKTFNDCFENVISKRTIFQYYNNYPTLFLVDPFGYNFSINKLSKLMGGYGNEIIMNFMYDYISRFLSVPQIESALNDFFGTQKWKKALNLSGQEKETFLVNLMKEQLKKVTGAKYAFPYRLCFPDRNRTYYYLIHLTNHIDGISLMKSAFASVNNGRVQYLGKNNDALSIFDIGCVKAEDIYASFLCKKRNECITVDHLWNLIVEDTAYTKNDLSQALNELVSSNKVTIERISSTRGAYKENDKIYIL